MTFDDDCIEHGTVGDPGPVGDIGPPGEGRENMEHPKRAMIHEMADQTEYNDIILLGGLDDAILGMTDRDDRPIVAYSIEKILEILMGDSGSRIDAVEYYHFNIEGLYAGEGTPIYIDDTLL